jgi:hypothetical protein
MPVLLRRGEHDVEVVVAGLVAEAARAAVDEQRDPADAEPEVLRRHRVVLVIHPADLDEMVAGPHRAELVAPPFARTLRHRRRLGLGEPAAGLDRFEVRGDAVAELDGAARAAGEHEVELGIGEAEVGARRAHAGGDRAEELVDQRLEPRADLLDRERAREQAHAAVDVVADAARRDHPAVGVEGGDAADREAVPPVDVGHGDRGADDPRQAGDVGDLGERLVPFEVAHLGFGGEDQPVGPHAPMARQAPAPGVEPLERRKRRFRGARHQRSKTTSLAQPSASRAKR